VFADHRSADQPARRTVGDQLDGGRHAEEILRLRIGFDPRGHGRKALRLRLALRQSGGGKPHAEDADDRGPGDARESLPSARGRERFAGIAGTSIVSIFGMGFAATGLSQSEAKAEGFSPVSARIEANSKPKYFLGVPTTVELIADRTSRRLIGGSVIGEDGAAGRINVIAAALQNRMRVEDFEQLDLAYSPPFSPVWDPLLIAAQQLLKEL